MDCLVTRLLGAWIPLGRRLYLNRTILEVYVASLSLKTHALHFSGELPAEREL